MKVRVVYNADKTVSVIHPALKSRKSNETEEQWLKRVFTKAMNGKLKGLSYDDMDKSELPQSREDRNAWEGEKGKGVSINQGKVKEVKDNIERERKIQEKIREIAIKELEMEEK